MLVPHLVFNLASTKDSPILSEILTFTLRQLELLLGLLQGIWVRWGLSSLPIHPGPTKWTCRGVGERECSQWPYPDDHMTWLLSLSCQYVSGLSQRLQMGIARRWKMPHLYSNCQRDIKWPLPQPSITTQWGPALPAKGPWMGQELEMPETRSSSRSPLPHGPQKWKTGSFDHLGDRPPCSAESQLTLALPGSPPHP